MRNEVASSRTEDGGGPRAARQRTTRVSWHRLLVWAGGAEAAALLIVAAILADIEAAAIGVGFLVALALLRIRSGVLGRVLIGLLSANVAAWMILGTVSNLTNREGVGALLIPATLTALAVLGVVAALFARRGARRSAAPLVWLAVVAALLVTVLVTGAATSDVDGPARPGDLTIGAEQLRFTESELQAAAGEVGVVVANGDLFWHTFTIDELGVDLAVPVQASRRVQFTVEPGSYAYYCRIPGHEALMNGTLTVE